MVLAPAELRPREPFRAQQTILDHIYNYNILYNILLYYVYYISHGYDIIRDEKI